MKLRYTLRGAAEFERELIRGRAVANGGKLGRKPTLSHQQQQEAIKLLNAGKETQGEIARPMDDFEADERLILLPL